MPFHQGVFVQLHSQFGVPVGGLVSLHEYPPPPPSRKNRNPPKFYDEGANTVNIYVPVLPGANFWLSYKIFDIPPPESDLFFVMKLFLGRVHVVTWFCGKEQDWKGKTMFALFHDPSMLDARGNSAVNKRAFNFSLPVTDTKFDTKPIGSESNKVGNERNKVRKKRKSKSEEDIDMTRTFGVPDIAFERFLDIKVYRANGKKRIPKQVRPLDARVYEMGGGRGIELKNAGLMQSHDHPKRFYQLALVDPKDKPYITFRYFYRTCEELRSLGVDMDFADTPEQSSIRTITPSKNDGPVHGCADTPSDDEHLERQVDESPSCPTSSPDMQNKGSAIALRRLSIPPSVRLLPTHGNGKQTSRINLASAYSLMEDGWVPSLRVKDSVEGMKRKGMFAIEMSHHEGY